MYVYAYAQIKADDILHLYKIVAKISHKRVSQSLHSSDRAADLWNQVLVRACPVARRSELSIMTLHAVKTSQIREMKC